MPRPHPLAAAAAVAVALATAGCATDSTGGTETTGATREAAPATDRFPVTIKHAFGSTTIEKAPVRVATLGWSDQDHALALGVAPVGATRLTWGGNEEGSSDWFDAALAESGLPAPTRYDDADGAPVVEVAKTDPDVILATNSGITEAEYRKLSKIAPVVAYPEAPWVTPWQASLEMVGKALGRSAAAMEAAAETESAIKAAREKHGEIEGKSMIFAYLTTTDLSVIGMYAPQDPRVAFMHDLGLVDAPAVADAIKPGEFYGTVSAERASSLQSDVVLTWSENPGDLATFTEHKLIGQIPALARGNAYAEVDKHVSLAVTNPTPLSIPVSIERFVPEVAKAVRG